MKNGGKNKSVAFIILVMYILCDFVTCVLENQVLILTKHISLERSDSQGSIFGDCFIIDVIL